MHPALSKPAQETRNPFPHATSVNDRPDHAPAPAVSYPEGLAFVFAAGAARSSNGPALIIGDWAITYSELDDTARRWAARLVDATQGTAKRVGICAYRSPTTYVGTLAAAFAGAAFVPLNPNFPSARTRAMIDRAGLDAILVDSESLPVLAAALDGHPNPPPLFLTDGRRSDSSVRIAFDAAELARGKAIDAPKPVSASDIAYLLFTSGSTGDPKGVPVSNGNVGAFLAYNRGRYVFGPGDRLSQTFDHTFDLSIFDMFMAWGAGAAICVAKAEDLARPLPFISRHGITVWFSVPSIGMRLLRSGRLKPSSMPNLRWSLFCGEALPRTLAEAWQAAAPNAILENLYGPTELTIACACHRWEPATSPAQCENGLVPVGTVYPHLSAIIVNEQGQPVAAGDTGELCVSGPQTFPGYWQANALTSASIIQRPDSTGNIARYYKTGDIVRKNETNEYVFLGRRDSQIKVNGCRIELGEIEAALRDAGCAEAIALAWPCREQAEAIIAFVTGEAPPHAVKMRVQERLPRHMIPRFIEAIATMPLNVNGKIDRLALGRLATQRVGAV